VTTQANRGASGRLPRNVWAASRASFLTDVSSEMVLNLLPLFLANVLGLQMALIGPPTVSVA
jgi:hypothetical protein